MSLVPDSLLGRRAAENQGSGLRRGTVSWGRRQGCGTSAGADTAKLTWSCMEFMNSHSQLQVGWEGCERTPEPWGTMP